MNKKYKLTQGIYHPMGGVLAGTESVFHEGFYVFKYIGRKFNQDNNGWLGNGFMISNPESMPEWFEEVKISLHDIDIQNARAMLVADGYEVFSPKELFDSPPVKINDDEYRIPPDPNRKIHVERPYKFTNLKSSLNDKSKSDIYYECLKYIPEHLREQFLEQVESEIKKL